MPLETVNIRSLLIFCAALAFVSAAVWPQDQQQEERSPSNLDLDDRINVETVNQLLTGQGGRRDKSGYYFGFDLRGSPQEDARQYLPFLAYLSNATGYQFKLRFSSQHSSVANDLGAGKIDFAAVGAVSFIEAANRDQVVSLVRGVNEAGRSQYQSFIVVRPDSDIRSIADLRGRRLAFGSASSTQGHLIPRILLAEQGISLDDLADYEYTGSHSNCANAVINGEFDACGMQDTMAKSLIQQGFVKLLFESSYYPSSGIAANKNVPSEVVEAVRQALVTFDPGADHTPPLYNWHKTEMPNGFVASADNDYDLLREWLIRFGLLKVRPSADQSATPP